MTATDSSQFTNIFLNFSKEGRVKAYEICFIQFDFISDSVFGTDFIRSFPIYTELMATTKERPINRRLSGLAETALPPDECPVSQVLGLTYLPDRSGTTLTSSVPR
ncbi:MAG: hypothetical protein ACREVE_09530 [Gammaproteobacteria bacterium]